MPPLDTIGHLHGGRRASRGAKAGRPTLAVTLAELEQWLSAADARAILEYHRGTLPVDRAIGSRLGDADRRELDRVATAAMALARAGRVHLVQRRHGDGDYSYLMVVRWSTGKEP